MQSAEGLPACHVPGCSTDAGAPQGEQWQHMVTSANITQLSGIQAAAYLWRL